MYEFVLGMVAGFLLEVFSDKNAKFVDVAIFGGSLLMLALVGVGHDFIKVGVPMFGLVLSSARLNKYIKINKILVLLGDWSYSTYRIHVMVISVGIMLWEKFQMDIKLTVALIIFFVLMLSKLSFSTVETLGFKWKKNGILG